MLGPRDALGSGVVNFDGCFWETGFSTNEVSVVLEVLVYQNIPLKGIIML